MKLRKLIIIALLFGFYFNNMAQTVRPVRDTVGFCWTAEEMNRVISYLGSTNTPAEDFEGKKIVAAISPHDDYLYAGRVTFPIYPLIHAKEIVIFGVTHGTVRRAINDPHDELILDDYDEWLGPYGNVKVSPLREKIKLQLNPEYFIVSDKAQKIEHSIEALVPFLQYYNRDVIITPIMITQMSFEKMEIYSQKLAEIIESYINDNNLQLGKDIFFLISNDANHYGKDFDNSPFGLDKEAHKSATENDRRIISNYLSRTISPKSLRNLTGEIWSGTTGTPMPLWCGRYPIVFGLLAVSQIAEALENSKITGELLNYSDTMTEGVLPIKNTSLGTTAPVSYEHWVGFFSEIFFVE